MNVVISSGHGSIVRGAEGVLDEVDEARKVVNKVAELFKSNGVGVYVFHDDVSTNQNENLHRIVDFHNSKKRDLDISVHFNAYQDTEKPMGTECLYVSQEDLSAEVAAQIAHVSGLINRGPKERTDLYFLNTTDEPAILIEVCFVDSRADAELYEQSFGEICEAIAEAVTGGDIADTAPPPVTATPPPGNAVLPIVTVSCDPPGSARIVVKGGAS